jgi:hypothetical protein
MEGKKMQTVKTAFVFLAVASLLTQPLLAQEKSKPEEKAPTSAHPTPLKVQIVFTEFEGDKKVKSMPYTSVFATDPGHQPDSVKLRIGSRVPLFTGKEGGLQYIDIGTNLDCTADRFEDGRFGLRLALERSWIQGDVPVPVDHPTEAQVGTSGGQFKEPVIGQYKTQEYLIMRDGQTVESTVATDPLTGRVLKIELTLTLLK